MDTFTDCIGFREMVYANDAKKIDQDKILLKFMQVDVPKRKTTDETVLRRNRKVSVKYFIRTSRGNIAVCAATFQKITGNSKIILIVVPLNLSHVLGASKDRRSGISKKFIAGQLLVENRGGRVPSQIDKDISEAIKTHISSYKCRENHYSRKKCRRNYLPPELNIQKMYKIFCDTTNFKCSLAKYKKIFYENFNLGFGNPHSDTCFICKELLVNIRKNKLLEKRNELLTKYRLHKMRAKAFFK